MLVEILGLSQNISFGDGSIQNYVNLKLPNGKVVLAEIDDNTSMELVALSRGTTPVVNAPTPSSVQAPPMHSEPEAVASGYTGLAEENGDYVFGGETTPDDVVQQKLDEAASQVASISRGQEGSSSTPTPVPHWNNSRRSPTVQKDDYGYPRLSGADTSDPGEIAGDSDDPEETQQI